jgi:hypothetical protein
MKMVRRDQSISPIDRSNTRSAARKLSGGVVDPRLTDDCRLTTDD